MTSIILSTICALALNAAPLSAPADTNDVYMIDFVRIENFNGNQLAGKTIYSYKIQRENIAGVPTRIHLIITGTAEEVARRSPAVVLTDQNMNNATVVSLGSGGHPSITIRPTSVSVDDILYFLDGKQIASEEFKKLDPKDIASMEVMKDASAEAYLQGLKDQGLVSKDINPKGGVILVKTKKGSK